MEKYFLDLYANNPGLFNDSEALRKYVNSNTIYNFNDTSILESFVSGLNLGSNQVEEQEVPEKKKDVLAAPTVLPSDGEQEESSSDSFSSQDSVRVKNILRFIGDKESNNDPNRFRGDVQLGELNKYKFEDMSIGEVLSWQEENKDDKGRYRAVGQYQFMPETLTEFMEKSGLKKSDRFSRENQEKMTLALLREGGLDDFLSDPDTHKEKFTNTIARRYASMPLLYNTTVNGKVKKRGDSRYGGSNKALVTPVELEDVLNIVPDIINFRDGKDAKEFYQHLEQQLQGRMPFGGITTKFLQSHANIAGVSDEKTVTKELELAYGHMGYQFKEAGMGSNQIVIIAPNGKESEAIELPGYIDAVQDLARETFFGDDTKGEIESGFTEAAKKMRNFMGQNYIDPVQEYINGFKIKPIEVSQNIFNKYVTISQGMIDDTALEIEDLERQLKGIPKYTKERSTYSPLPGTQTQERQINPQWKEITNQIKNKRALFGKREDQKSMVSGMIIQLLDQMGGPDFFIDKVEHGEEYIMHLIKLGLVDKGDLPTRAIMIDGKASSPNLLKKMLTDYDMRVAHHNREYDITLDEEKINTKGNQIRLLEEESFKDAKEFFDKHTTDGTWFGKDGRLPFMMNQIVAPGLASGLEYTTNFLAGVQDLAATPFREASRYYFTNIDNHDPAVVDAYVEQLFNPYYSQGFKKMREEIRKIRDEVPITEGGIADSESFTEFALKGGVAASESAFAMGVFVAAPQAALISTGLSVYGESMQNYQEQMARAQDMGSVNATYLAPGYKDLTIDRARMLSMGKGLTESLITRAFTYRYVKGLSSVVKNSSGASYKQLREVASHYGKSAAARTGEFFKAAKLEVIEEDLITLGTMFIDDASGIEDYDFNDYVSAVKETTLATLFTSGPMSYFAQKKRNRQSTDFVRSYATERFMYSNEGDFDLIKKHRELEALISEKGIDKVTQATVDAYEQSAADLMTRYQQRHDMLFKYMKPSHLRAIVTKDLDIQELSAQYKKAETKIEKETIKKQIEKRYTDFRKTIKQYDPADMLTTQTDFEMMVKNYQLEGDVDSEETETKERAFTQPNTPFEEAARKVASSILEMSIRTIDNPNTPADNIIMRKPELFDELVDFFNTLDETLYTKEELSDIASFYKAFSGQDSDLAIENRETAFNRGDFSIPKSTRIGEFYNKFIGRKKITDEIRAALPAGAKKLDPFTRLESYSITPAKVLLQKKGAFVTANIDHMIKMLLKNDQMSQPLTTLSNEIDVGMAKAHEETRRLKESYDKLSFLGDKVSKKRREAYFSRENEIERAMVSFLQKDVKGQDNYLQKKQALADHLADRKKKSKGKLDEKLVDQMIEIYQNVVAPAPSARSLNDTAKSMNIAGLNYLRQMFNDLNQGDAVLHHMSDNLGKVGTLFNNYLPVVYGAKDGGADVYFQDDQTLLDGKDNGPGQFYESTDQTSIPEGRTLLLENFDNIVFNAYENSFSHMLTFDAKTKYNAVINSKEFESLFDTDQTFKHGLHERLNKFDYIKELLLKKTSRIDQIQKSVNSSLIKPDVLTSAVNLTTKVAAARRLAAIDMPLKQGLSAMFGAVPVVGNTARGFLIGRIARFANPGSIVGQGGARHIGDGAMKIIAESLTQMRGGGADLQFAFLDNLKLEDTALAKIPFGKSITKAMDAAGYVADKHMDFLLANSDKIAGLNTFLAYYMDYDIKNNPEARKVAEKISFMDSKAYWDWASQNMNRNAIAYADQQVDRSQTQTAPWNIGGAFGTGKDGMNRALSQVLFLFGRFAYNRKVGMANDMSILSSDIASSQDKSAAGRRLASAAIEIGVFKAIGPVVGVAMTEILTKLIGSLLGVDEELDKQIEWMQKNSFDTKSGELERSRFYASNYKRNVSREFGTALFEGFIPLPTPPVINELAMAAFNANMKAAGITEEDVFNLYGPTMRNISEGTLGPLSEEDIASFVLQNSGIGELVAQDYTNMINDAIWVSSGKMPKYNGVGPERRVTDQAQNAMRILVLTNLMNMTFAPSADVNRFQRTLRKVIERDFLVTRESNLIEE